MGGCLRALQVAGLVGAPNVLAIKFLDVVGIVRMVALLVLVKSVHKGAPRCMEPYIRLVALHVAGRVGAPSVLVRRFLDVV